MKKQATLYYASVSLASVVLLVLASCGIPVAKSAEPTFPVSRWGQNYAFNFETPPPAPPKSVDAAIIVVETEFWKTNVFDDESYRTIGDRLAQSMGVDLQKIVIARGMTALGPYETYDEVVYGDKKNASLMLAPKLEIQVTVNYFGPATMITGVNQARQYEKRMNRDFEMIVGGYLTLVMMEPLSREKMWIKKFEIAPVVLRGVEQWEAMPERTPTYGLFGEVTGQQITGWNQGAMVYDDKPEVLADMVSSFYQTVLGKCWTFIDPQEILDLKATAQEIRNKVEYGARPSY
jgi:hypothetical protein